MPDPYLWADLRKLSDEELIAEHDRIASRRATVVWLDYYRNELTRRETTRLTQQMRWCTIAIGIMTLVITVATVYLALSHPWRAGAHGAETAERLPL